MLISTPFDMSPNTEKLMAIGVVVGLDLARLRHPG